MGIRNNCIVPVGVLQVATVNSQSLQKLERERVSDLGTSSSLGRNRRITVLTRDDLNKQGCKGKIEQERQSQESCTEDDGDYLDVEIDSPASPPSHRFHLMIGTKNSAGGTSNSEAGQSDVYFLFVLDSSHKMVRG